ncbi:hypothetical protein, partial [Enterobacter cloacae complex sp. YD24/O97A9]|uniref:hypothetical protein n=1 Tax=Enterobacter cloacae complex sp. YD24/O97A9 TaxID=3379949 RepID=UPI003B81D798
AAFMPGASPPLVNTPIFLIMTTSELRNAKLKSAAGRNCSTVETCFDSRRRPQHVSAASRLFPAPFLPQPLKNAPDDFCASAWLCSEICSPPISACRFWKRPILARSGHPGGVQSAVSENGH